MAQVKIAIHHINHSASERWIEYCQLNSIPYKIVDCTQSDIIHQLIDCDGLMWHWGQSDYRFQLFARQLTFSLEKAGKKVFPNSDSCWHFDDKVGQKYLLEALKMPLINSNIFFTKKETIEYIRNATFPKVFKLRGGAGSVNVSLVKNRSQVLRKTNTAFGKGFPAYSRKAILKEKLRKYLEKRDFNSLVNIVKSLGRLIFPDQERKLLQREKGYAYFQDFIPDNDCDIRLVVIGERCFGTRRFVRKNDFRASGSGIDDTDPKKIDTEIVKKAFELSERLGTQSLAFDFLRNQDKICLAEISYGIPVKPSDGIPGFWDKDLNWHEGTFKSQYWIIENFLKEMQKGKN